MPLGGSWAAFLDRFAQLVGTGTVLEIGSGPGRDASYLEGLGLEVDRTDATPAFVEHLRAAGFVARRVDVRRDELATGYAGVLAQAVLLHLSRSELHDALLRVRAAVVPGGVLAMTLKEGDGHAWSTDRLGLPRHFTYWRAAELRDVVTATGWTILSIENLATVRDPWLFVLASPTEAAIAGG